MGKAAGRESSRESSREPWTIERTLHLTLAAVAIAGWALVYTTLMRGIDRPQEVALSDPATISANIAPRQAPNQVPSIPATPAALR